MIDATNGKNGLNNKTNKYTLKCSLTLALIYEKSYDDGFILTRVFPLLIDDRIIF